MAEVIFIFNGLKIPIQCKENDKMKEICQKFSSKIGIDDINSIFFIYSGNNINFELTFKEQINKLDLENNKMNIIASYNNNCKDIIKKEIISNYVICKCGVKIIKLIYMDV